MVQFRTTFLERKLAGNHEMHAKYGIGLLQMEITMAVLGDLGRSVEDLNALLPREFRLINS